MRPFFSIRIEWNPADSKDQLSRDGFLVKRSVARQAYPCPTWTADKDKRDEQVADDMSEIATAITSCIEDLSRAAGWRLPELLGDIVFDLASQLGLESQVLTIAKIAADGSDDEFLDALQKIIDDERPRKPPEPQP